MSTKLQQIYEELNSIYEEQKPLLFEAIKNGQEYKPDKSILDHTKKLISKVVDNILPIMTQIYGYPNKRVLHLALHSKSRKTKNKNIHRIQKWLKKRCNLWPL